MPTVTEAGFWRKIGEILAEARGKQSFYEVKRATGIDAKTIQSIEAGQPGLVEKLSLYAKFFRLDLVDLFRTVLSGGALTSESAEVMRLMEDVSRQDRVVIRDVTRALASARAGTLPTAPAPPPEPRRPGRRKG